MNEANLYHIYIETTDTDAADMLRKLLSGYGSLINVDDQFNYEVMLTPDQAQRIQQRHGDKLSMMLVGNRQWFQA